MQTKIKIEVMHEWNVKGGSLSQFNGTLAQFNLWNQLKKSSSKQPEAWLRCISGYLLKTSLSQNIKNYSILFDLLSNLLYM